MIIRRMTQSDAPAVAALERECFSQPWPEHELLASLARPEYVFLVAEEEKVVGYAGMIVSFDAAVTNVAVAKDFRRKGAGRALVEGLIREAAAKNVPEIFLEVRASNTAAISLYESLGFTSRGVRKNFYEFPTEDGIIYGADTGAKAASL